MNQKTLTRVYVIRGLDRVLYASPPQWSQGTFGQESEDEGRLTLTDDRIASGSDLAAAVRTMDEQAERFRLAISRKTECPLAMKLEKSVEPSFGPPGAISGRSSIRIGAYGRLIALPEDPPPEMPQLSKAAARWVLTLAETKLFRGHPDESLKRLQLLIEEFKDRFGEALDAEQRELLKEVALVRHFVSHPLCTKPRVCSFIALHLPDAVKNAPDGGVQFDRTNFTHMNFVASWEMKARELVAVLLEAAIKTLP